MAIDATGAWILIGACCAATVPLAVHAELRRTFYGRHRHWREAPGRFAGVCAGATLTGLAIGMAIAFAALMLAALAARAGA